MSVSENIRKVRLFLGIKQTVMAQHLGISQPHYNRIESGMQNLSEERLSKISELLGVSPDELKELNGLPIIVNNVDSENVTNVGQNINYSLPQTERELYEAHIKKLEDEIVFLRTLVNDKYKLPLK